MRHSHAKDTSIPPPASASQRCLGGSREGWGWRVTGGRWTAGGHISHLKLRHPSPQGTNPSWELTCGFAPSAPLHSAVPTSVNMGDNDGNRGQSETKGAPVMADGWVGGARGVAFREAVNTTRVRNSMEAAFLSHPQYCSVIFNKVI